MGGYASRGVNDKHYAVFTTEHIRNLVEGAGFRVTSIFYEDIPEGLMKSLERFVRRWKRFEHLTYPRAGVAAVKLQQVPVLG
jgi:hypothetical protein